MLWLKGWQETRVRVFVGFALTAVLFFQFHFAAINTATSIPPIAGFNALFIAWIAVMLAGSGIATQAAFNASKGLDGSTLFTLSLPVSRLRLLAVRAALGWLEMAAFTTVLCAASWSAFPGLRAESTPRAALVNAAALIVCASSLYAIAVLMATFLDDLWRMWFSMLAYAALFLIFRLTSVPARLNIFRAMTDQSPLVTHKIPWTAMGLSLAASAVLFLAALKIVRRREY
jgi:hypothetical protein